MEEYNEGKTVTFKGGEKRAKILQKRDKDVQIKWEIFGEKNTYV